MISSYNITSQDVAVNGLLTFSTDRILTGCTATRNGQTFQLNKPGNYYVTFNADGAVNLAFSTIIKVPPSCCAIDNAVSLTLVNTGVAATYTNVNINITKLC